MSRGPPRSTRTNTLFPYPTLFRVKELQDAATQNAGAVKQLAGEMRRTLASRQQGASQLDNTLVALQQRNAVLERELRRANRFSLAAATAALLAFALSAYALAS